MAKRNASPLDKILGTVNNALDKVPGRTKPASGIGKVTERLRSLTGGQPKQSTARRSPTLPKPAAKKPTPARKTTPAKTSAGAGRKAAGTGRRTGASGRRTAKR